MHYSWKNINALKASLATGAAEGNSLAAYWSARFATCISYREHVQVASELNAKVREVLKQVARLFDRISDAFREVGSDFVDGIELGIVKHG